MGMVCVDELGASSECSFFHSTSASDVDSDWERINPFSDQLR